MTDIPAIPRYHLYGEALSDVERSFIHVETVKRRSSLHNWRIRIHAHPDHHQVLLLTDGGGTVLLEENRLEFRATAMVFVSALTVHGFQFQPDSDGYVVTVSTEFMHTALEGDAELAELLAVPGRVLQSPTRDLADLIEAFRQLQQEFTWPAPARRIAIKSGLQRILVSAARLRIGGEADLAKRRSDADLVIRYRKLVEEHFRERTGQPGLARMLGVTPARLNAATRAVAGKSALRVVHDRIIIEAKRHLLYTGMTVGEIAILLGFNDPAYFNRFFALHTGTTPGMFRAAASPETSI